MGYYIKLLSLSPMNRTLIRYRWVIMELTWAGYCLCVGLQNFLYEHSLLWGGLNLALFFWYVGRIEDRLKERRNIEEAAMEIQDAIERATTEHGCTIEELEVEGLLIKQPALSDYILPAMAWGLGVMCLVLYWGQHKPFYVAAGIEMGLMGLLGFYLFSQPDPLLKSG